MNSARLFYIVLKKKNKHAHKKPYCKVFIIVAKSHFTALGYPGRGDSHAGWTIRMSSRYHRPQYALAQPRRWRGSKACKSWGSESLGKPAGGLMMSWQVCWSLEHWMSSDLLQVGNSELFHASIRSQQSLGAYEAGESCCQSSLLRQSAAEKPLSLLPTTTGADVPARETCKCRS